MMNAKYIKIIDNGAMYTTHTKSVEYGCVNWKSGDTLKIGKICKVINTLYINDNDPGYIIRYNTQDYLIKVSGTTSSTQKEYEQQFMYKIVHCKTQKQWDFVTEKLNYQWSKGNWDRFKETTFINLDIKQFDSISKAHRNLIFSFQEWLDDYCFPGNNRTITSNNNEEVLFNTHDLEYDEVKSSDKCKKSNYFEPDVWYRNKNFKGIAAKYVNDRRGIGFINSRWKTDIIMNDIIWWEEISMAEVESIFTTYAETNYPAGTIIKSIDDGFKEGVVDYHYKNQNSFDWSYTINFNGIDELRASYWNWMISDTGFKENNFFSNPVIYKNGKWAEIIESLNEPSFGELFFIDLGFTTNKNVKNKSLPSMFDITAITNRFKFKKSLKKTLPPEY